MINLCWFGFALTQPINTGAGAIAWSWETMRHEAASNRRENYVSFGPV